MEERKIIRSIPDSDSNNTQKALPSGTFRPYFTSVSTATGETAMVIRPTNYSWDGLTAGTAPTGLGAIKVWDEANSKIYRVPLAHSVWDD